MAGRTVARFSAEDTAYIADVLRGAYKIVTCSHDSDMALIIGDFVAALEDCDAIEIVEDEEYLVDAD